MSTLGQHSRREILRQGIVWQSALDGVTAQTAKLRALFKKNTGRDLLFIACGSPHFANLSLAAHAQALLGVRARAVPSSDLLFFSTSFVPPGPPPLAIVLSRSGETSETIAAAQMMHRIGADIMAVGCDAATSLLKLADLAVEIPEGREVSVAQTGSFSGMLLAAQTVIAVVAGDNAHMDALRRLPGLADGCINGSWRVAETIIAGRRIDRFFFLGSGTRYGLACEATLKMKEMSLSHAEPFHVLEFRHGPMSLVDEHTLVVGLISEQAATAELAVLREMRALGAQTVALGEATAVLEGNADTIIAFESGLPAAARDVLYMPFLQSLAFHRAMSKGLDCDNPRNLVAFVKLPKLA
jgi:glucosamine--fructose-6-phosphate aminotransferase (isomerizing)